MKISRKYYLDCWIFGPNLVRGIRTLVMNTNLTAAEQSSLNDISTIKNGVPFNFIESYSVTTGAVITLKGPWAGITPLAFNLSFYF